MKPVILIIAVLSLFAAFISCAPHRGETAADRDTETPQICLTADIRPEIQQLFKALMLNQEPISGADGDSEPSGPAPKPSDNDETGPSDLAPNLAEDEQFMVARRQMKERKDDLNDAKRNALLGETLSGRVGPVREDVPESVLDLAQSENRDRVHFFRAIAWKTNHPGEEIARQYRIFMYRLSDDNHLLHDGQGRWAEKKELDLQAGDW